MTSAPIELTDPATELVSLGEALRSNPPSDARGYQVVAKGFGMDPASVEFIELLGAIGHRVADFCRFVSVVEDDVLTDRVRAHTIAAATILGRTLGPMEMAKPWKDIRGNINDERLGTIGAFARTARDHRPLRRLSDDERADAITRVEALLAAVETDPLLPPWAKAPSRDGLLRLLFVLKHIVCFGHAAALDTTILVRTRTEAIQKREMERQTALPPESRGFPSLWNMLQTLAVVQGLLHAPIEAYDDFNRLRGWVSPPADAQITMPQRCLPSPTEPAQPAERRRESDQPFAV